MLRRAACLTVVHAILIQNAPAAASNAQYDVIAAPVWVLPAPPLPGSNGAAQNTGSASYLLVDRQVRLDRAQSEYAHFITRINNVAGVQDESQIRIEFDPKMDKLHVHSIVLRRGPIVIDELKEGRIRILQREGELDDDIVNGNLTFDMVMSDLRVGDIIDYSYTIETHSPEWGNRFYGHYKMQWDDPVSVTRLHVIAPAESRLRFRSHGTAPPTMASDSGWQSADWTIQNGAPAQYEKTTPEWIEQYQSVEYSQFDGWSEVGALAKSLFAVASAPSAELLKIVSQIEASAPTESERALAAIKFVQEEIRYTGIEEGDAAFRPRPPNDVLRSRYGDCKDKTLLAVTMLRLLKISAAPALVSTRWRDALDSRLPSPGLFDHAVVRATIGDKPYWFDVTVTGQRGTLSRFDQAHFGKALVLAAGARELESMPQYEVDDPPVVAHETMDFRGGIAAIAPLTVSTRYFLTEADAMRRKLRTEGIEALAKKYLQYYQDKYPGVTSAKPLVVSDDPNYDQVTIEESYTLHGAFAPGKSGRLVLDLYPDTVDNDLNVPKMSQRKQPLEVEHPVFSADKITVFLPLPWKIKETEKHIDTPAFEYESRIAYVDNKVTLDYRYKSHKGQIEAADFPQYRKDVKRARDDTGFNLSTDARSETIMLEPGVPALAPRAALIKLSILLVGLLVLRRSARYVMTVRLLMTVGFRHPRARVCSAADLCPAEVNILAVFDQTLEAHDFRATGYLSYSAPMNPFIRCEFLNCFVDKSGATLAIVERNPLPEYAPIVRLAFETPLSTGQWLRTTSHPDAQVYSSPARLSQLKLNLSPEELLTEHAARLDVYRVENAIDIDSGPNRYAEGLNSAFTIAREEYRRRGWMQPTADPNRDRFTVLGACRMGFRVVRSQRGTGKLAPRVDAWTDADRSRRIDADCVALLHSSGPLDLSQGTSFRLIGFMAVWVTVLLLAIAGVWGIDAAVAVFTAIVLHEAGHGLALWLGGGKSSSLVLLPLLGLIRGEESETCNLGDRNAIMMAGPLFAMLVALAGVATYRHWPQIHIGGLTTRVILLNCLTVWPIWPFDGARILASLVRPTTALFYVIQWLMVGVLLGGGIFFKSDILEYAAIVALVFSVARLKNTWVWRPVVKTLQASAVADMAPRLFKSMTSARFESRRAIWRLTQARLLIDTLTSSVAQGTERRRIVVAYAALVVFAIAAYWGTR